MGFDSSAILQRRLYFVEGATMPNYGKNYLEEDPIREKGKNDTFGIIYISQISPSPKERRDNFIAVSKDL